MARPKAFNPTDALDQALRLFQVTGYLGTSMDDLVRAMGISRASLYDTFGNKDDLYHAALERYLVTEGAQQQHVCAPARTAREYFQRLFDHILAQHRCSAIPTGCLMVSAATERWHLTEATQTRVAEVLEATRAMFQQVLVDGVHRGELQGDPDQLATAMLGTLIALRTMSRAGMDEALLRQTAELALRQLA